LLTTIAWESRWITISLTKAISSSLNCLRSGFARAGAAAAGSAGGTRIDWPASTRSPGAARLPSMRSCPVRAQRDTILKLASGRWRLNQRSRRMPSSSGATVN
jgi:hypothetical protein